MLPVFELYMNKILDIFFALLLLFVKCTHVTGDSDLFICIANTVFYYMDVPRFIFPDSPFLSLASQDVLLIECLHSLTNSEP